MMKEQYVRGPRRRQRRHAPPATIDAFADRCEAWARGYYQSHEHYNVRDALRSLRAVAGDEPLDALCAEMLIDAQEWMVRQGLARQVINDRINRIRRCARWARKPPQRWIGPDVLADLALVEPLRKGRTPAQDPEPVSSVPWELVSSTIAAAADDIELATAIELQWWTGARPGEIVHLRRDELHEAPAGQDGMIASPSKHKTAHYGIERAILIPPSGVAVLGPWLRRARAVGRFERGEQIFRWASTTNYRRTISRLNRRHQITHWTPNQIRHSFATWIRAEHGPEAAQILLGHRHIRTTEIYAERNMAAAWAAIRSLG